MKGDGGCGREGGGGSGGRAFLQWLGVREGGVCGGCVVGVWVWWVWEPAGKERKAVSASKPTQPL